jgi:hypothetical protein
VDGFVLILAIIVFSVFRNFITEAKKKADQPGPGSFEPSAEQDEAQEQALDALRQWQAKQRSLQAGGGEMDPPGRESVRIPRPGEHRTDVRLPAPSRTQQPVVHRRARPFELAEPTGAEQTRREAYDAIRELLAGKTVRPSPPVRTLPDPGQARAPSEVPAPSPSAAPMRARDRTSMVRSRSKIRGTVRRRDDPYELESPPREARREQGRTAPAGLNRLDSLPPVARGIIYAELFGKPVAFREPREGWGD